MNNRAMNRRNWAYPLIAPLIEPYARYQYANVLHALRLGVAVVAAMLVNRWTGLDHGEWTTITVFIILALLQYQGAIYTKAKERILGTLLGIVVGLGLLLVERYLAVGVGGVLYYLLIGISSGIIGYYAVKQLGYVGLLTGITMCMIISSSGNTGMSILGHDGIIRATNVLLGTLVAVLATMILPLKATLMWRFLLAGNLDACSTLYAEVGKHVDHVDNAPPADADTASVRSGMDDKRSGMDDNRQPQPQPQPQPQADPEQSTQPPPQAPDLFSSSVTQTLYYPVAQTGTAIDRVQVNKQLPTGQDSAEIYHQHSSTPVDERLISQLRRINKRLLAVRPHLPATARESGINLETLETIQHTHRNIIATVDLLLAAAPRLANVAIDDDNHVLMRHYQHDLSLAMQHMAAVLRSPSDEVFRPITRIYVSQYPSIRHLPFEWQGYFWLTQTLQAQLQRLSDLLQTTQPQWFVASGLRYQRHSARRISRKGGESELQV